MHQSWWVLGVALALSLAFDGGQTLAQNDLNRLPPVGEQLFVDAYPSTAYPATGYPGMGALDPLAAAPAVDPVDAILAEALDLNAMTTDELLDLYAATYEESLRGQAFDLSRLALPGHVIFQVGYTYSSDTDELDFTTTEHTFPEYLLRYRIAKRVELRAGWAGVAVNTLTDELSGVSDRDTRTINPTFGVRVGLWKQYGRLPRTSITASTPYDLETQGGFRDHLNPRGSIGYSWLLDDKTLLSGSTGLIWTEDDGQRYTDLRQSLSVATFVNDEWDLHLTWQALLPEGRSVEDVSHSIGPGFSFRFTPTRQCDVITGIGIDEHSPDFVLQVLFTAKL